jgi:hypothetical protein
MCRRAIQLFLAVMAAAPLVACADLIVSNGNFNSNYSGSADYNLDVASPWFDRTIGNITTVGTVHLNTTPGANNPFGTYAVGLTGGGNTNGWIYQLLGTRSAEDTALVLGFDLGSYTNAGAARSGNMTVAIYQSATFTGANNSDIAFSGLATLVDSDVLASGSLSAGQTQSYSTTLDISGANTADNLYLRFYWSGNNVGGQNNGYMTMDNVTMSVVPEPGVAGLLALGSLLVYRFRRTRTRA